MSENIASGHDSQVNRDLKAHASHFETHHNGQESDNRQVTSGEQQAHTCMKLVKQQECLPASTKRFSHDVRGPLARSEQSSEANLVDSPAPSSVSDGEDDTSMYGIVREHQNGDSPAAAIHALSLKSQADRSARSSPCSSNASGIKRPLEDDFTSSKPPLPTYDLSDGEQADARSRTIQYTPQKHSIKPAAKRHHAAPKDDTADFVAKKFGTEQTPILALVPRQETLQSQASWASQVPPPVAGLLTEDVPGFDKVSNKQLFDPRARYSRMFLQPETTLITQAQLAAEVKGIYAGLVMVEAKSINIDAQQAANPTTKLAPEQWQALIALRRTLLYEHHDFLMATQHPSASPALRGLAAKYCMPARMWKHGIHGFLEVLRHRRPASQDYMLTFIYLAYDMMALLFETVPAFTDTWIECLGDLARYRMAIEEDKEIHAIWGGVAARWYTMAADRHPQIGRLYHHLGILERPSLRKLYYYSRSLTSVVPFINARESLGTLCAPILQDDAAIRHGAHSAEAMTICYHARGFSGQSQDVIERDGNNALALLKVQTPGKIASYATPLAVTNIASMFEFGQANNIFKQLFASALARAAHNARPSILNPPAMSEAAKAINDSEAFAMTTYPTDYVIGFYAHCFNNLIRRELDHATVRDLLQYVHVNLVWICALLDLRVGLSPSHRSLVDKVLAPIDWDALATFLNELASIDPITTRVIEHACYNAFLLPENWRERHPLAEDFMIRGIAWAEGYFPIELFDGLQDDDGSRVLETPARLHLRAERVEWLACCIALPSKQSRLTFDRSIRTSAWIKTEHATSPLSARSTSGSLEEDYDAMSVESGGLTQFTPSVDSFPSRNEDSYVDVKPVISGGGVALDSKAFMRRKLGRDGIKIESQADAG